MGRPLNKRLFGTGPGKQIQAIVRVPRADEADGYILRQKATNTFLVSDMAGNEGICKLVQKEAGTLLDGEMIIVVKDDRGIDHPVAKLTAHRATLADGTSTIWSFDDSAVDGIGEMSELQDSITFVVEGFASIPDGLLGDPATITTDAGSTITIASAVIAATPIEYQWQISTDNQVTWTDIVGQAGSGVAEQNGNTPFILTDFSVNMSMNGAFLRVVVSDELGQEVISDTIALTVEEPQV